MWFSSWLRVFGSNRSARRPAHPTPRATRCRPQLEVLEDRCLPSHMPVPVPSTLTVTNNADSGAGSLRAEIAAANPGDTIDLLAISGQTINLSSGELLLNKNLTIQVAAGDQPVTISGGDTAVGEVSSRVFEIDGAKTTVALNNLNISGGDGVGGGGSATDGEGGAIFNAGKLTLTDCNLSNNSALGDLDDGGAIFNAGSLMLNNCILDDNTAGNAGGGNGFRPPVAGNGGAIYNAGSLTVNNCILDDNTAVSEGNLEGYGGAIFNASNATASVTDTSLSGNDGIGTIYNDGTMTLSGCTVTGNFSSNSSIGGIFNDSVRERHGHSSIGQLTIQSQSSVVGNDGQYDLYNLGSASISTDSTVGLMGP